MTLGHNNPPSDLEILQNRLLEEYKPTKQTCEILKQKADELPVEVESEDDSSVLTDFIKQIEDTNKVLEKARKKEKEGPFELTKAIDKFFNEPQKELDLIKERLQKTLGAWLKRCADEERKRREAEAARIAKEAEEKISAALQEENVEEAKRIVETVEQAQAVAAVADSKLAFSTGEKASATVKAKWIGIITDKSALDLEALRPYLTVADCQKALNGFIAAGGRELKGAQIQEEYKAKVR